jgi:hypothetical protein
MTRDEAVELFGKMEDRGTSCLGEDLTDWAVAVGILKVDAPPTAAQVGLTKLALQFRVMDCMLQQWLDENGIKIVEK